MPPTLDKLPDDILALLVFEYLHSRSTLIDLSCTCHKLRSHAEPKLWSSMAIRHSSAVYELIPRLQIHGERSAAVKNLAIELTPQMRPHLNSLSLLLRETPNINRLLFIGPMHDDERSKGGDDDRNAVAKWIFKFLQSGPGHLTSLLPGLRSGTSLTPSLHGKVLTRQHQCNCTPMTINTVLGQWIQITHGSFATLLCKSLSSFPQQSITGWRASFMQALGHHLRR